MQPKASHSLVRELSNPCDLTNATAAPSLKQISPQNGTFGAQCQRFRITPQQYATLVEQLGFEESKEQGALFGERQSDGSYVVRYAPSSGEGVGVELKSACSPEDADCNEEVALTQQQFLSGSLAQRLEQCDAVNVHQYHLSQAMRGNAALDDGTVPKLEETQGVAPE